MTIKNRTFEWRAHLDSYNKINKRNLTNNLHLNNNHSRTEFSRLATTIAKDIESTTLKLQKLTQRELIYVLILILLINQSPNERVYSMTSNKRLAYVL